MGAGQHVDKIHLLTTDNLRQPLPVLVRQHVQVVMRQFITEDIGAVLGAQDTDPHRCGGNNLTVKLLVFLQTLGIAFSGDKNLPLIHPRQGKQRATGQHVQQDGIHDKNTDPLKHHIHRQGIDDTQRRWR